MKTIIRPLYRKHRKRAPLHLRIVVVLVAIAIPYQTFGNPTRKPRPYQQEFLITAYYSPLPGQCCYVKGGLEADKILNGQGIAATDGTPVYPGMIAAPSSYAFGTKVTLPGLGTFTVHDRGGAIVELESGKHRLDIWAGHGEEGLARALAVGLQSVKGWVYPVGGRQPEVAVNLDDFPAPVSRLETYFVEKDNFLAMQPKEGDTGLSVRLLQEYLQEIGYLKHKPTGFFGPQTKTAFESFLRDFQVDAEATALTEKSAAFVLAARKRLGSTQPFHEFIDPDASSTSIAKTQRLLRFLGYYKGRTNGQYDDNLFASILKFQQEYGLVGTADNAGAGRIGPITSKELAALWNRTLVSKHADHYLYRHAIDRELARRGNRLEAFLEEVYSGSQVRLLQNALAALGFFPAEEVNGNFGEMTKKAVLDYQLDRGLIADTSDEAAGYVGPATLRSLRKDQHSILYSLVRAQGWKAL